MDPFKIVKRRDQCLEYSEAKLLTEFLKEHWSHQESCGLIRTDGNELFEFIRYLRLSRILLVHLGNHKLDFFPFARLCCLIVFNVREEVLRHEELVGASEFVVNSVDHEH